ncbi:MAG: peptide ABC transporter substrate-binding protein [Candidatus Handelsmanbacteria bacterium RIFCSPLOWO2_12_FULL_64_10]|uniref:Peptide ABC transporter substrate-binding protein n=1 Tax=Handelsmanbacteria sp. (strain RIFCSPLOWO2_12_FULL_64_10) TaxID=1817868 RepID=A0A1F6C9M9_HANXR|nr:MAG: peptide ABC transporter substrate-binding protein [Candidatus Handelsmanbacteria bacterium RIFCSPLOWO2_12_FULL_64_10]
MVRNALILCCAVTLTLFSCAGRQGDERVLVMGRGGDSVGLDPALEDDGESFKVCDNLYDTLVQYKQESTDLEPGLAESWESSPDGLTWTLHLRGGVKFHDGTEFNADAVVFSLRRQYDETHPAHKVEGAFKYWKAMSMSDIVREVRAQDARTVVIELKQPNAPFLSNLAMNFCAIVSPTAVTKHGRDYFKNPCGTGPFRFKEWIKDDRIVLERNPDHWRGAPGLDRLVFRCIPDNSVRLLELKKGTIDGMDNLIPDFLPEIQKDPNLQFMSQPGMNVGYLAMNGDRPPFDNVQVRRAVNHAVHKQALVDNLFQGLAVPAKNPIPPVMWGYNDDAPGYAYDPDRARALLAEAGLPNGFETELWAMSSPRPYMPQPLKIAQAIQADLSAVGIRAKIVTWEWGTYLNKVENGDHPMALLGWIGDNGDPDNFLYVLLDKTGAMSRPSQNIAFYRSDELHEVLVEARQASDHARRTALYRKAQEIVGRDAPWAPLVHTTQTAAFRKRVRGFHLHPTGSFHFFGVEVVNP